MSKHEGPRCSDCGARWVLLDDDGLCQDCVIALGLRAMTGVEQEPPEQPYQQKVTGQRLAAIIATAAAQMPQAERLKLWLECCRLLGPTIDSETHPELYAVVRTLREPIPDNTKAAKWN